MLPTLDSDDSEDNPFHSTKLRSIQKGKLFGSGIDRGHGDSSEGSDPEEPVVTPSERRRNTAKGKAKATINIESEDEDEIVSSATRGRARSSISKPPPKSLTFSKDDSEDSAETESEVSGSMSHRLR